MAITKRRRISKGSYLSRGRKAVRMQNVTGGFTTARGMLGNSKASTRYSIARRVFGLERMVETKEGAFSTSNVNIPHNNVYIWSQNVLATVNGTADPMLGTPNRIGDQITVKGISACFFVEGSLQRSKVHFRIMLLKGPRGASFDRADIFKGMTGNKLIDQLNTEKYTVVAQKRFDVSPPNTGAYSIGALTGVPVSATASGITGNKIVKFWIPGRKFGRGGHVQYENASANPKFFDYRWVLFAYDWYGTPQDTNNVGFLNECWSKLYFKDA